MVARRTTLLDALMSRITINAIPEPNRATFEILSDLNLGQFYLGGGTGLALQIGHRYSIDFDLFSENNQLRTDDRLKLKNLLSSKGDIEVLMEKDGTLALLLNNINVTFFYYPYPIIEPGPVHRTLKIASITDIALMKLSAVVNRGNKKDFIDLYFIIKDCISLDQLLHLTKEKFRDARDFAVQALRALTYFFDADLDPMPKMIKPVEWERVKNFFLKQSKIISLRNFEIDL